MEKNLRIGIIEWFGGYNTKKNRINNGGIVNYLGNETPEWLSIHSFSDDTKEILPLKYKELSGEIVICFEKESENFVYLIKDEKSFLNFPDDIVLKLLKDFLERRSYYLGKLEEVCKSTAKSLENFNKIAGYLIKHIIYENLNLPEIFNIDELTEENLDIFKYVGIENLMKYFASKKDYSRLYTVAEIYNYNYSIYFDADFNDLEDLSSETYSIVGEVSEETLRIFKEFAETNRVFQRLNNGVFSNANIDLDYPKKDYIAKIKAIETNDIEEIKKYIEKKIIYRGSFDIKNLIDHISQYDSCDKLEEYFIEGILKYVEKELKDSYSIKKYLSYFDGTIVFHREKSNKLYDDLRGKLLSENIVLHKLIEEKLLCLNEKDKSICNSGWVKKAEILGKKLCYNRYYYSWIKEKEIKNILNRNIEAIYDFKNGKKIIEVLNFFLYAYKRMKVSSAIYNHTLVTVPSSSSKDTRGLENLVKLICLLTGIKNGFNMIKIDPNKSLVPKHMGGKGIVGSVICSEVKTKYAIVFDDVCTESETLSYCAKELKAINPELEIAFFIAYAQTKHNVNAKECFINEEFKDIWFVVLKIKYQYSSDMEEIYFSIPKQGINSAEDIKNNISLKYELKSRIPEKNKKYKNHYSYHFHDIDGEQFIYRIQK